MESNSPAGGPTSPSPATNEKRQSSDSTDSGSTKSRREPSPPNGSNKGQRPSGGNTRLSADKTGNGVPTFDAGIPSKQNAGVGVSPMSKGEGGRTPLTKDTKSPIPIGSIPKPSENSGRSNSIGSNSSRDGKNGTGNNQSGTIGLFRSNGATMEDSSRPQQRLSGDGEQTMGEARDSRPSDNSTGGSFVGNPVLSQTKDSFLKNKDRLDQSQRRELPPGEAPIVEEFKILHESKSFLPAADSNPNLVTADVRPTKKQLRLPPGEADSESNFYRKGTGYPKKPHPQDNTQNPDPSSKHTCESVAEFPTESKTQFQSRFCHRTENQNEIEVSTFPNSIKITVSQQTFRGQGFHGPDHRQIGMAEGHDGTGQLSSGLGGKGRCFLAKIELLDAPPTVIDAESVSNYLKGNPEFLEAFVGTNVDRMTLHNWIREKNQSSQSNPIQPNPYALHGFGPPPPVPRRKSYRQKSGFRQQNESMQPSGLSPGPEDFSSPNCVGNHYVVQATAPVPVECGGMSFMPSGVGGCSKKRKSKKTKCSLATWMNYYRRGHQYIDWSGIGKPESGENEASLQNDDMSSKRLSKSERKSSDGETLT